VLTSSDELVVHRRADWKDVYPGYWDVCFGGVLGAGERWDAAAHRELLEEAGVDVPLELLGVESWEAPDARLNGRVYLGRSDGPFTWPDGEVVVGATVPLPDLAGWLAVHDVCPDSVDRVVPRLPR
jgi:8-oxo-dGTP pyrophosphatase MutT (NUDIX family)